MPIPFPPRNASSRSVARQGSATLASDNDLVDQVVQSSAGSRMPRNFAHLIIRGLRIAELMPNPPLRDQGFADSLLEEAGFEPWYRVTRPRFDGAHVTSA